MLHYKTPTLLRHGDVWIYHFPSRRQVTIRCPRNNAWVTHTRTLSGAGLIGNATTSSITFGDLRPLPELHGATRANLDAPSVYVAEDLPILTRHELPRVEAALTAEVNELDQLKDRLETSQKFSWRRHPVPHAESYISPGNPATLVPNTRRNFLHFHYPADPLSFSSIKTSMFTSCCIHTNKSPEDATPQSSTSPAPTSEHPTTAVYSNQYCDSVTFATYALPCKN